MQAGGEKRRASVAGRPPDLEPTTAAQPRTTDASARGAGELAGCRQRPVEQSGRGVDQRAIGGGRDRVAQRVHGPAVAVVGAQAADPRAVDRAEVPEAAARRVEGVVRGTGTLARRSASTAAQPSTFAVEQVDLERPGDVVDAVAVRRVRPRPDRVLHDPHAVGQDVEMEPAQRGRAVRGQTPTAVRTIEAGVAGFGAATVAKRSRYTFPTADQTIRRLWA